MVANDGTLDGVPSKPRVADLFINCQELVFLLSNRYRRRRPDPRVTSHVKNGD